MRTEQMRYFLESVKTGSFTKAAENLHIQQPSLREAIINLENELGGTLFYRSKKGVELSEFGQYCLPYFQLMYESYEKMKLQERFPAAISEKLCIDVQNGYEVYLSLFYNTLTTQLKGVEIRINTNNDLNEITNRLIQNKIDLGFVLQSNTSKKEHAFYEIVKQQSLEQSTIANFELVVLMKKDHPLAEKKTIEYVDLYKYKLILGTVGTPSLKYLEQKIDVDKMDIIKTSSWKLTESYLSSQMAIAISAKGTNSNEELVTRPLEDAPIMTMSALYKKGNMNENILRGINTMKLVTKNYI